MMTDLMKCHEAVQALGVDLLNLIDILAIGDIIPTAPDGLTGAEVWARNEEIRLSANDIDLIKVELRRRRFDDFRVEYADVYQPDPRPGYGGLQFGPGWTGILVDYADGIRDLTKRGRPAWLRRGKEKFGALRLYSDHMLSAESEVIQLHRIALQASLVTCQECGQPARLRFGHSICLTLCDRHAHIIGEPDPGRDGIILDVDAWAMKHGEDGE
ncbi:hypothetical protein HJB89_25450 [Rhizobium sp. NZLR8]|uniref:hypothetical protein n=1 Tax=Rhizobium sp. NZLR8 TaxID=2731104 RepID=UPI001C82CE7E|nr:hypothetical protein [Rhizobium sp. NZLR8]MBX5160434.1 hypothetical protein [Rhizobium sp. NZLR8]